MCGFDLVWLGMALNEVNKIGRMYSYNVLVSRRREKTIRLCCVYFSMFSVRLHLFPIQIIDSLVFIRLNSLLEFVDFECAHAY